MYDLFKLSAPHYDVMEDQIGVILGKYCQNLTSDEINVLELGTGTGQTLDVILSSDPRIRVVSCDNESQMVEVAKASPHTHVRVIITCEDALSFLKSRMPESVDAVVTAFTIHNLEIPYREQVFEAISKVLKPGGIFINCDKHALTDYDAHQKNFLAHMTSLKVFDEIGRPDVREAWENHYIDDEKIKLTEDSARFLLTANGFDNIEFSDRHWLDAICTAIKLN